jgi:hypothetical protein
MSLKDIYSDAQIQEMLREAVTARHQIATQGTVQEIRVLDRLTRFHKADLGKLDAHIADLNAALGRAPKARSFEAFLG